MTQFLSLDPAVISVIWDEGNHLREILTDTEVKENENFGSNSGVKVPLGAWTFLSGLKKKFTFFLNTENTYIYIS